MKPDPKFFEDISRMAGGAFGMMAQLREQMTAEIRSRIEEFAGQMNLVSREEFEKLETRIEQLTQKIEQMEQQKTAPSKAKTKPKKARD